MTVNNGGEEFEPATGRPAGAGTVRMPPQTGLNHFRGFGLAIDEALKGMSGTTDEVRELALTAKVQYIQTPSGDPGIVIEYTATLI